MVWLAMAPLVLLGALLIKLLDKKRSQKIKHQNKKQLSLTKLRLEPSVELPKLAIPKPSYSANHFILSNAEQIFFKTLQQTFNTQFIILIKIRVCDIL